MSAGATTARCDLAFAPDLSPFSLRHRAPDTELLAGHYGELEAFSADRTLSTDLFRGARRGATFREEQIRVCTATVGEVLPGHVYAVGLQGFYEVW
jgi:hypothetical protein